MMSGRLDSERCSRLIKEPVRPVPRPETPLLSMTWDRIESNIGDSQTDPPQMLDSRRFRAVGPRTNMVNNPNMLSDSNYGSRLGEAG
jgi:hypothetical protein